MGIFRKIGAKQDLFKHNPSLPFIKIAPENPVLWTGMKGASAKGRRKSNQMLKRVQHDNRVGSLFCHPELVSGSRFWF
jgi:hypothetical protein